MKIIKPLSVNIEFLTEPKTDLEQLEELLGLEDARLERFEVKYVGQKINPTSLQNIKCEIQKIEYERDMQQIDSLYERTYAWLHLMLKQVESRLQR